jgi:hypothetical protein
MNKVVKSIFIILCLFCSFTAFGINELTLTFPNNQTIFIPNNDYAVTWQSNATVLSTDVIEVLFSVDNGRNFLIKLSESVNDGQEVIRIPKNISNADSCKMRIRLKTNLAIFDDSDFGFKVSATAWSLLIDNLEDVSVVKGYSLARLSLFAFNMIPFKKWNYNLNSSFSNPIIFYTSTSNPTSSCFSNSVSAIKQREKITVVVSKTATYRFSNFNANGSSNFNSVNLFRDSLTQDCNTFRGSTKQFNGSNYQYSNNIISTLKQGDAYTFNVFNEPFYINMIGYIELFNFSISNTFFYQLQATQSGLSGTFVAVDENNMIKKISPTADFKTLNPGNYKVFSVQFPTGTNLLSYEGASVYTLSFQDLGLNISQNFVKLTIKSPCVSNINLTQPYTGIYSQSALNKIQSNEKFGSTSTVSYRAGKSIELLPGFSIPRASMFKADILDCN